EDVPGTGAALGRPVVGVEQAAELEREAAAPDAAVEPVAEPLEHRDLMVEAGAPRPREALPIVGVRGPVLGERGEGRPDFLEAQADLLRDADERDPSQGVAGIAPLTAGGTGGADQALGFVEAQRRR